MSCGPCGRRVQRAPAVVAPATPRVDFEFVQLPSDVVATLDDMSRLEHACEHVHVTRLRRHCGPRMRTLIETVESLKLIPHPFWVTSRYGALVNSDFAFDWHQDYRHVVRSSEAAAAMKFVLYVAGEPRLQLRDAKGTIVDLPVGAVAVIDGLTWHRRAPFDLRIPARRWFVRFSHFPSDNPKSRTGNGRLVPSAIV